ncbi:MAG: M15 family metallopeptidase, partial [Patescibacteria group bacterium]
TEARFDLYGAYDTSNEEWYSDDRPNFVGINIAGKDCAGEEIQVSLISTTWDNLDKNVVPEINFLGLKFPEADFFTIFTKAGETKCDSAPFENDCGYFLMIDAPEQVPFLSDGKPDGNLNYECDGSCDKKWSVRGTIIPGVDKVIPIGGTVEIIETDTTYTPLAPIPGFNETIDTEPNPVTNPCPLGRYINLLMKVILGIAAVLALIMIVQGGLQYATTGLWSSKEAGTETIQNALMGLVIALSAVFILNTVNPRLLNICLDNFPEATITVSDEPETGIGQGKKGEQIQLIQKGNINTTVSLTVCDKTQMQWVDVFNTKVEVYKGLVPSLRRINAKWLAMSASERYKVDNIFGYDCRTVAGSNKWSAHAYGVALDINPDRNPFGKKPRTDMPPSFVKLFKEEGWGWGGEWRRVKDAMHYSKYPPSEKGNRVIELN